MKEVKLVTRAIPAAFWKRVLAYLVDFLAINLVIVFPFRSQLEKYSNNAILFTKIQDPTLAVITLLVILLSFGYFILLEYKIGQTLGKALLKLTVTSKKEALTFKQVLVRNLTKPFPLALVIDSAYMFLTRTNQRLFEKFSSTEVVENQWTIK